ncbi:DNA/RNA helicase, superfamily II (fragment) [Crenothrix polyspora]|uniref:DNA/RNA helicase, superfamily II n=1 Tax=Crenothrix polyspora TaxID=360316 RepID=A0A1R4HBS4_9GAMM
MRIFTVCLPHLCEQWQAEIQSKLDLETVIIRSNTQARLDRQIQGDTSVYDYYPFQVISIDFIKSDTRRNVFIEKWLGEDTPFPDREAFEWSYELGKDYAHFFDAILDFTRKLIAPDPGRAERKRVQYWTALALLRGVMSSPAAGIEMLNTRLSNIPTATNEDESVEINPVQDSEFGFEGDYTPTQVVERNDWSSHQRQQLKQFAEQLQQLSNINSDQKLASAGLILEDWLNTGFNPVVFCRYIATANYVGNQLVSILKKKFPKLDLQVITSESPDELRKQRIEDMAKSPLRILIATDCLSEGINLQEHFTGVLHYDLPWNPNRLEQREGRVDRFGQMAPVVKACLLYGADNPIDGIVLDVILRKIREIKKSTGINVPFPEDSQSIIDTITQSLLLNPDRKIVTKKVSEANRQQLTLFDFSDFDEAAAAKEKVSRKIDQAAEREKVSRGIFAQNAIKAHEIEADLKEIDEAIGDPFAVESFVTTTLNNLLGTQVTRTQKGYRIVTANLPPTA